jgi:hypothetical protein
MPVSSWAVTPEVAKIILINQPKTVLDLGIGHGMNGAIVRNWLDNGVKPYKTHLEGVEGFNYRSPLWECYNVVHECTIQKFFENDSRKWGAILLTDVIEHFDKLEALEIIRKCKDRLDAFGVLLIVTPGIWIEQDAVHGNELEVHKSRWTWFDFTALGFSIAKKGDTVDEYGYQMVVAEYVNR